VNVYQQGAQLWLRAPRSLNADAFATFALDDLGRASRFKMKPISPATDFSYDFQDLDLQWIE
jgi:hypothetical protein